MSSSHTARGADTYETSCREESHYHRADCILAHTHTNILIHSHTHTQQHTHTHTHTYTHRHTLKHRHTHPHTHTHTHTHTQENMLAMQCKSINEWQYQFPSLA